MDDETCFLTHYKILKMEEITELNKSRDELHNKIVNKEVSKCDLVKRIYSELYVLRLCKLQIDEEREMNAVVFCINVLCILCKRIVDLFGHMHDIFAIDKDLLLTLIKVCQQYATNIQTDDVKYLTNAVAYTEENLNLWIELLKFYIDKECYDLMLNVFEESIEKSLKENIEPLCNVIIRYLRSKNPIKVSLLCTVIPFNYISYGMRLKYFKWCKPSQSINTIRVVFSKLQEMDELGLELYMLMIKFECMEENINVEAVRCLYNAACQSFGHDNVEVWINYIRFEFMYGDKIRTSRICTSGIFRLNPILRDDMNSKFKKLQSEINQPVRCSEVIIIDDD